MDFITPGIVSLLFFLLSYLVWGKKKLSLLAGYQEGTVQEKDKLARYSGIFFITLGILTFFIAFVSKPYFLLSIFALIGYVFAFIIFVNVKVK